MRGETSRDASAPAPMKSRGRNCRSRRHSSSSRTGRRVSACSSDSWLRRQYDRTEMSAGCPELVAKRTRFGKLGLPGCAKTGISDRLRNCKSDAGALMRQCPSYELCNLQRFQRGQCVLVVHLAPSSLHFQRRVHRMLRLGTAQQQRLPLHSCAASRHLSPFSASIISLTEGLETSICVAYTGNAPTNMSTNANTILVIMMSLLRFRARLPLDFRRWERTILICAIA